MGQGNNPVVEIVLQEENMEVIRMGKPEKTFRQGSCSASVFVNGMQKNGQTIPVKSVSVQRSYKKDGSWKNTNSYGINDLPKLALVASKAYDYLTGKEGIE